MENRRRYFATRLQCALTGVVLGFLRNSELQKNLAAVFGSRTQGWPRRQQI